MKSIEQAIKGLDISAIGEDKLNDLELLDMLDDIAGGNALKLKKVLVALLGDQWAGAMEACRDEGGTVRADKAADLLVAIFEAVGAKN